MKKKLLLAGVAAMALLAPANAADLRKPVYKAPVIAPMPVFSWTNCYVGGHGGWGRGREHTTQNSISLGIVTRTRVGDIDTEGAIFGGQIGCDYQLSRNWVIGVEGDLARTWLSGSSPDPRNPRNLRELLRVKTEALGSVTGRLGFAGWIPQVLVYAKGGGAWIHDRYDFRDISRAAFRGDFGENFTGWTVGAGVEYLVKPNWSVFAEFNYYDFGNTTRTLAATPSNNIQARGPTIEAFTVGVNYRFDLFGSPSVIARY